MEERKNKSFGIKYFLGGVLVTCLVVAVLYFVAMWLPLGGARASRTVSRLRERSRRLNA